MEITLNGSTYELGLTIDNLKDFGLLPGKMEANLDKLSDILMGLKFGDPFILVDVLTKLLKKDGQKRADIEKALNEDPAAADLFDKLTDFFSEAPLTKKLANLVLKTVDSKFKELEADPK